MYTYFVYIHMIYMYIYIYIYVYIYIFICMYNKYLKMGAQQMMELSSQLDEMNCDNERLKDQLHNAASMEANTSAEVERYRSSFYMYECACLCACVYAFCICMYVFLHMCINTNIYGHPYM
jgi:hypothetical protein